MLVSDLFLQGHQGIFLLFEFRLIFVEFLFDRGLHHLPGLGKFENFLEVHGGDLHCALGGNGNSRPQGPADQTG